MRKYLLSLIFAAFFSYADDSFICSAQYVDNRPTPPKTIGVKENDFVVIENGKRYSVISQNSEYRSEFITKKDNEGVASGFDGRDTLFMKTAEGIYSLKFNSGEMKDVFIMLINCKEI